MSEHDTQAAFFEWAEWQKIPGIDVLFAVPNGGSRNKFEAFRLKQAGVKAGVPDVIYAVPRGGFVGLAIEFKHGDGNPSKEQRLRIDKLQREGWCVAVCWSLEAAASMLKGYAGMLQMTFPKAQE